MVTHVIFDVDGTILDTESLYIQAKQKVVERYGGSHLFSASLQARTAGKQAGDAARLIVEECGLPLSPLEFLEEMDSEIRPLLASARLKPGVRKLVEHLTDHNVPVAIATSSRQTNSKLKMSGHQELFSKFDHKVFGSDDPEVVRGKPNPDIFLVAASRFADPPVVMVPEHNQHPGATEVLPSLEQFNPAKYGLPAYDDDDDTSDSLR